jgi:hypothetical protein
MVSDTWGTSVELTNPHRTSILELSARMDASAAQAREGKDQLSALLDRYLRFVPPRLLGQIIVWLHRYSDSFRKKHFSPPVLSILPGAHAFWNLRLVNSMSVTVGGIHKFEAGGAYMVEIGLSLRHRHANGVNAISVLEDMKQVIENCETLF